MMMEGKRSNCRWMSGPAAAGVNIPAARWWLAVSRDWVGKEYRRQMCKGRPPVTCQHTPKFVSPLGARRS
jgi:hypothetical protein